MIDPTRFPRRKLGHFPTALEPMPRLTAYLRRLYSSVPTLWIKRDDSSGLATGGNKVRKLEFLVGDALSRSADTLITCGATQSNHARQTAAAAASSGMDCKLILEQYHERDNEYRQSGNVLLCELLDSEIVDHLPAGSDLRASMESLAESLREAGKTPYVIPVGGSTPLGSLGYVLCAQEITTESPVDVDWIVHASGSAGTQAGLIAGLHHLGCSTSVLGISVRYARNPLAETVHDLALEASALLESGDIERRSVHVDDRWIGTDYGLPTESMIEATRLLARTEGILLDPIYTGKGFAGLLGNIAEGRFDSGENVVFLHTGGTAGLFGYRSTFSP